MRTVTIRDKRNEPRHTLQVGDDGVVCGCIIMIDKVLGMTVAEAEDWLEVNHFLEPEPLPPYRERASGLFVPNT